MIRIIPFLLIIFSFCLNAMDKKICDIDQMFKYASLKVTADKYYILDQSNFIVYIYSKKTNNLISRFGKRGEGPGEFKSYVGWTFLPERIVVASAGKVSYFSRDGKLLKEIPSHPNFLRIKAIGENIAGQIWERTKHGKLGNIVYKIIDPALKKEYILYRRSPKDAIYYGGNDTRKQDMKMIQDRTWLDSNGELIAVGDSDKGFKFQFFNMVGKPQFIVEYKYKKRPVSVEDKKTIMENYINRVGGERFKQLKKSFNYVFPEYYPPFYSFSVGKERLYVFTHLQSPDKKKQELMVMDFKGNLINRLMVPRETNSKYKGKYYYLTDNEETEAWELRVTDL